MSSFRSCSVVSSFAVIEPGSASGSCTVVAQVGVFILFYFIFHPRKVTSFLIITGLKGSLGTLMKLSLLMLLRNRLPQNPLSVWAAQKVVPQIRIVIAGKVKVIGRRIGEKPMQERGSLLSL